jgi:hypothetical protein
MRKTFITLAVVVLSVTPLLVMGAGAPITNNQYQPLAVGIPGVTDKQGTPSLISYLNAIFTVTISLAATFAVLRIVIAGFQYMMTDAWGSKEEALGTIWAVVTGLIVLLLSVVVLKTINPDLLNLDILRLK